MKRSLFYIFCLLFLIPVINVKAASITGVNVSGTNSVKVGEEFTLSFNISYSDVKKGTNDTMGVAGVVFQLDFDDDVFIVTGGTTPGFNTEVDGDSEHFYVESVINEYNNGGKCLDGVLHCDNYVATIKFYVRDTDKTSSNISISNANVVLIKVNSDYEEKDAITISNYSKNEHTINIIKTDSIVGEEPKNIVSNSKSTNILSKVESKISNSKTNTSKQNITTKQISKSNNDLKSLKIKNHKINFDKEKLDYKVIVKEKENNLEVEAVPESEKASVMITGADDLKKNNYKVLVEVTAQDGSKKAYTINAEQSNNKSVTKKENKKQLVKLSKNTIKIISISLGSILIVIIVLLIIKHKSDKKLNKMLDEFDKL